MDNLRHFKRTVLDLDAELMHRDKAFAIQVKDISIGGAYIESGLPMRIDDQVELRIFLSNPEHVIEVNGRVAWLRERLGFGIEFQTLQPYDVWALLQQTKSTPTSSFTLPSDSK